MGDAVSTVSSVFSQLKHKLLLTPRAAMVVDSAGFCEKSLLVTAPFGLSLQSLKCPTKVKSGFHFEFAHRKDGLFIAFLLSLCKYSDLFLFSTKLHFNQECGMLVWLVL